MEIYVQAKSKKAINEALTQGKVVHGYNFSIFGNGGNYALSSSLPVGTVIKVYEKVVGGSPYPKSYGTWDGNKVK
jgi:hypothetical protein